MVVPASTKAIGRHAFAKCSHLRRVIFSEGLESLGRDGDNSDDWSSIFFGSGVEEVVLPGTLREMRSDVFNGSMNLKTVLVRKGSQIDVRKFVDASVEVKYI